MIESLNGTKETVLFKEYSTFKIFINQENEGFPSHWHLPAEIIMPLEGCYQVSCNGKDYNLSTGDILFIRPGMLHRIAAPCSGSRYIAQISLPDFKLMTHIPSCILLPAQSKAGYEGASLLHSVYRTGQSGDMFCEPEIFNKMLSLFILCISYQRGNGQRKISVPIEKALAYIQTHFTEELLLEDGAAAAGFSKYYFSKLFKEYTGDTFYQYVEKIRIKKAVDMLAESDYSVTSIAFSCGFHNLACFIRMFRLHMGVTPGEYRKLKVI